jgi:hypothetical protein
MVLLAYTVRFYRTEIFARKSLQRFAEAPAEFADGIPWGRKLSFNQGTIAYIAAYSFEGGSMEPEIHPSAPVLSPTEEPAVLYPAEPLDTDEYHGLRWIFIGSDGLRAGWSVLFFGLLISLFSGIFGSVFVHFHLVSVKNEFTVGSAFFGELVEFVALLGAAALLALIEGRRSLLAYNLTGPRRVSNFFAGLIAGFAALSALVAALDWGGWLHFGSVALSGAAIFRYGLLWGCAFLLVGCVEEGIFRCYLQFTLTRGINFWWALGCVSVLCLSLLFTGKGNGPGGVYAMAVLGLFPCLYLHLSKTPGSGFWQATWVTSTLFGYIHTGNPGESWIGIFAAALIGFVFCVSVRLTGSAWWAIGCHAAWDWAETYFYGTADSGLTATGHYLTTNPVGNALWSGGADGPEASLLVLGVILLLLAALMAVYGRKKTSGNNQLDDHRRSGL